MISTTIQQLVNYGLDTGLILPDDEIYPCRSSAMRHAQRHQHGSAAEPFGE